MYQIYLDELYGGLQKPNEDEKKRYVIVMLSQFLFLPTEQLNQCLLESVGLRCVSKCLFWWCRLAEKKASIGYTYEDSTVTEPDPESDKDEENSESESEEDEGIPDIGE